MEGLRDLLAGVVFQGAVWSDTGRATADALLAPDGPLFPVLRAMGNEAHDMAGYAPEMPDARSVLRVWGITGPLADACLAAAGVAP